MTDVSSIKAHAEPQPAGILFHDPTPPSYANGSPILDGTIAEEESSTIKCICGFSDDDGDTVLCEKCNTWQHIICYYEFAENVPDVHECTDCQPRAVDKKSAIAKQLNRRELLHAGDRKGKPKTTKQSHKKRVKDPHMSVQPNGWAAHSNNDLYHSSDRKSGSPRDHQPPPSKRLKTGHRASVSIGVLSQSPALVPTSRKRAGSVMQNGHSPVKSPTSPDGPNDDFSPQFIDLYRHDEPPSTEVNLYTDLRVANALSEWLGDREALAEATGGLLPADIFQRISQPIEDYESVAPTIVKHTEENDKITAHGHHPRWQYLTVGGDTVVPENSIIGELKGRIGRREDYISNPDNRWDLLRHPEPFVFFPPHLPIYLDTRQEGTILRYIRRSCNPNVRMKILMHEPDIGIHFCFIATKNIEPGEELTVGWEIDSEIRQRLNDVLNNGDIRKEGLKKIEPWVARVLANFGGCACDKTRGWECLLERARRPFQIYTEPTPPAKSTKGRKSKKLQISPLSTGHATNSRAGSEGFHRNGGEDDDLDNRSSSGSHKSTSRDITPATHHSLDAGDLTNSNRERRKLEQVEKTFEKIDTVQHKGKRGTKRNSAGSALNTPGLSSSVRRPSRLSPSYADTIEQKQLGQSERSPTTRHPREHSNGVARKASASSKMNGRTAPKPKPVYVDSSTQTEISRPPRPPPPKMAMRPLSFKHKLLQKALEDRMQRDRIRSASLKTEAESPALKEISSNRPSPTPPPAPAEETSAMEVCADAEPSTMPVTAEPVPETAPEKDITPVPLGDVDMKDVDAAKISRPPSPKSEPMPDAPIQEPSPSTSQPPLPPPPPLSPLAEPIAPAIPPTEPIAPTIPPTENTAPAVPPTTAEAPSSKPADLRVQPPPPEVNDTNSVFNSITLVSALAQSPLAIPTSQPPFSPATPTATNPGPGPMRKKLSLSDYTSRRAKLAQTHSTGTPPLGPHATSSPTLSTTSLPGHGSPPAKTPEPNVLPPVVEVAEEAKMV